MYLPLDIPEQYFELDVTVVRLNLTSTTIRTSVPLMATVEDLLENMKKKVALSNTSV